MTSAEKKYGENEHTELMLCPRCVCANPVKIIFNHEVGDGYDIVWKEYLCKKCLHDKRQCGAFIKRKRHIVNGKLVGEHSPMSLDELEVLIDLDI